MKMVKQRETVYRKRTDRTIVDRCRLSRSRHLFVRSPSSNISAPSCPEIIGIFLRNPDKQERQTRRSEARARVHVP